MQIDLQANEQLINMLHDAENVAIIPAKSAGIDAFCAGAAMHLMLKALDKKSMILYTESVPEGCGQLIEGSDVISSLSQRQLTVAIDYSSEYDAKAWYEPDGGVLKVKLAPVSKEFDPSIKVTSKLDVGFEFDTAIIIGANDLEDLGEVYNEIRPELSKSTIMNISNSNRNVRFGSINVIDPTSDSLCQLILKKAPLWELNVNTHAAQALLLGITSK